MTRLVLDSKNMIIRRTPGISPTSLPIVPQLGCVVSSARALASEYAS
jgi:hypothetical protein